jgi:rubrerythrin
VNAGMELNLLDALRAEAFAYARYRLYAQRAREHARMELARRFEEIARAEFEHFAQLGGAYGLVGSDERNLEQARDAEEFEAETMYPVFAEHARVAGEIELADRLEEIREDERAHRSEFIDALAELRVPS